MALWLALDNGPAFLDQWSLRKSGETGTATVLSTSGARPQRAVRRVWDDLFWGRGRRVEYRFAAGDSTYSNAVAFVTHHSADALRDGAAVRVRYLPSDPAIHRIEGEPGVLLLSFRLVVALALFLLFVVLLRGARSRPMLAIVFLPIAMASLAAQEQDPAFVIDLDTSGGFIGRGRGAVTIAPDGILRASGPAEVRDVAVDLLTRTLAACATKSGKQQQGA